MTIGDERKGEYKIQKVRFELEIFDGGEGG